MLPLSWFVRCKSLSLVVPTFLPLIMKFHGLCRFDWFTIKLTAAVAQSVRAFAYHVEFVNIPVVHLSRRLKWTFLIKICSLSVVVVEHVVVVVNFSHFHFLLQNHWANFNQTWHKASLGKGDSSLFKWRAPPFSKGK